MNPSLVSPSGAGLSSPQSVPVIVDDDKRTAGFNMTRCVYFHIDCEDTLDEWTMDLGSGGVPFRMIGLSGVIVQPFDGSLIFERPGQVGDLFSTVQEISTQTGLDSMMHVEVDEVWLPNELLTSPGREILRGDVFRIGYDLFRLAFAFTLGHLSKNEFWHHAIEIVGQVDFSAHETKVIGRWAASEIETAHKLTLESKLYLPQKRGQQEK